MSTKGGFDYTGLRGVDLKNTAAIRLQSDGGYTGTVSMAASADADRAYRFPDKSGTFPIMGTFNVQFPTITSTSNTFSTIVTVAGIRAEDAVVVMLNSGISAAYSVVGMGSGATARILNSVTPGNGNVTLGFINNGLTTVYSDLIYSYLAVR